MANLISTDRARYNLNNLTTTAAEDTTIAALVTACSRAVKRYCRREFDSQEFDELYSGIGGRRLVLRQFPVISVARVACNPSAVLRIKNSSASNQRATVAVTSTGLRLTRVASGTASTDTSVTWAGNATLGAVAAAVNGLGNGWSAAVADASFDNRASADLRAPLGALNAMNVDAELLLHVDELSAYEVQAEHGFLVRDEQGWPGGANYWRVVYTAGFATVPEDVQEACAQWVAALFWLCKRDPGLASENIPGSVSRSTVSDIPPDIKVLLAPYRAPRITLL